MRTKGKHEFRYTGLRRVLVCGSAFLFIAGSILAFYLPTGWAIRSALICLAVFSVAAVAEIVISRIEIDEEILVIKTLFNRKIVDKETIESVTWESGTGIAIKLKDRQWVKIPDLGHGAPSVANSIRSWLNRK